MSSVFQSHAGFQLIEQSFDDEPPSQQDFVQDWQEIVFHVAANAGDEVEPTLPEPLEEGFGDIALISKYCNSQAPPTFECYCQFYGESNLPFCACFFLSCLNSVAPG